jgi:hypothetical protein
MGWAYLAVSLVGAWFTFNAYRPTRRWQLLTLSFFAGWFTSELAVFHIAWQVVATVLFVWLSALESWAGIVGLVITLRRGPVCSDSSSYPAGRRASWRKHCEGLEPDYRSEIAPGLAERLAAGVTTTPAAPLLPAGPPRRAARQEHPVRAGRRSASPARRLAAEGGAPRPVLLQLHGAPGWSATRVSRRSRSCCTSPPRVGVCRRQLPAQPRVSIPDQLIDCKLTIRWIRDHIAGTEAIRTSSSSPAALRAGTSPG